MKIAGVFPGQGSQAVGMGHFLYENFKVAKLCFEEASDTLSMDFKKLCFEGPEADLALTENTQPALLLVSTAAHRALKSAASIELEAAAGHSIGEYAATVAAGSLSFPEALKAVRLRGEAMQSAVPVGEGAMVAAMGLKPEQVKKLCRWVEKKAGDTPLEPANYNAPGQIVLSGKKSLVDWMIKNFDKEIFKGEEVGRVKFIPLKVSAPFHCSLMKPAEEKMAGVLGDLNFKDSLFPVVQNFTAESTTSAEVLRRNLILQISGPVRWTDCVEQLLAMGIQRHIEFGHGKVLSGLAKKINGDIEVLNMNSLEEFKALEKVCS